METEKRTLLTLMISFLCGIYTNCLEITVDEGMSVDLPCEIPQDKSLYLWLKDGTMIAAGPPDTVSVNYITMTSTKATEKTIRITYAKLSLRGNYTCSVLIPQLLLAEFFLEVRAIGKVEETTRTQAESTTVLMNSKITTEADGIKFTQGTPNSSEENVTGYHTTDKSNDISTMQKDGLFSGGNAATYLYSHFTCVFIIVCSFVINA